MDKIWQEWISGFDDEDIILLTSETNVTNEHQISFEMVLFTEFDTENRDYFLEQSGEAGKYVVKLRAAKESSSNVQNFVENVNAELETLTTVGASTFDMIVKYYRGVFLNDWGAAGASGVSGEGELNMEKKISSFSEGGWGYVSEEQEEKESALEGIVHKYGFKLFNYQINNQNIQQKFAKTFFMLEL